MFASDPEYEQDERTTKVDEYTSTHLLNPERNKYHDALTHAYETSLAKGLPDISCSPTQGKFLNIQLRLTGAKNVLEVRLSPQLPLLVRKRVS